MKYILTVHCNAVVPTRVGSATFHEVDALVLVLQALVRNHDEVGILRKQCGEGLGVVPIDCLRDVCTILRTACSGFSWAFVTEPIGREA